MTHCRQDPHEPWPSDRQRYMTHCRQDLHRSMVVRQTQHYVTHCRQDLQAWSPDRHNIT